jgi:hypothetical protein
VQWRLKEGLVALISVASRAWSRDDPAVPGRDTTRLGSNQEDDDAAPTVDDAAPSQTVTRPELNNTTAANAEAQKTAILAIPVLCLKGAYPRDLWCAFGNNVVNGYLLSHPQPQIANQVYTPSDFIFAQTFFQCNFKVSSPIIRFAMSPQAPPGTSLRSS